jgi:predicted nucleic acid-binding Zn ribbon protein
MRCEACGVDFTPKNSRGRFCSAKCRRAAWQRKREDRESRLRALVKLLAREAGLSPDDFA